MKASQVLGVLLLIVVVVPVLFGLAYIATYNGHNAAANAVDEALGNVEADLQRRMDLVPQLVSTVKGYAKHEDKIFTEVAQARAKAGQVTLQAAALDPEKMQQFAAAQGELSSVLTRLMAVQENYPELKASENFLTLQSQLEGTENRIAVSRKRYNETVKVLNTRLGSFWGGIVASIAGKWQQRHPFEASEGAHTAPVVNFN